MLLEPLGPNLRTRAYRPLTTLQLGAAAGAAVMALSSTGDVLLLGALLGVAAGDVEAGAASVLAGLLLLGGLRPPAPAAPGRAPHPPRPPRRPRPPGPAAAPGGAG